MKKYCENAVYNFVSSKGTKKDSQHNCNNDVKEHITTKKTILPLLILLCVNAIGIYDTVNRVMLVIQIALFVILWLLVKIIENDEMRLKLVDKSRFQILSSIIIMIIFELMFLGCMRIVSRKVRIAILIIVTIFIITVTILSERQRILRALDKCNGIISRPFENMKAPLENGAAIITATMISIALGGATSVLEGILFLAASFTAVTLTRAITMHYYIVYFATVYNMESELLRYL